MDYYYYYYYYYYYSCDIMDVMDMHSLPEAAPADPGSCSHSRSGLGAEQARPPAAKQQC